MYNAGAAPLIEVMLWCFNAYVHIISNMVNVSDCCTQLVGSVDTCDIV